MISSTTGAYYPQFAVLAAVAGYQGIGGYGTSYQAGGFAVAALMSNQRLGGLYESLMHPGGCCCHCCVAAGFAIGSRRIEEDPYGISQSGQGMRSNLANSPEVMLALRDIFSSGQAKSYEDAAKILKEKYGIYAEVGEIKALDKNGKEIKARGLKFANGDYFVDGNGDGQLSVADYKFDEAVKALKERYGLGDEDLKGITEAMKSRASYAGAFGPGLTGSGGASVPESAAALASLMGLGG
ncbi:MAG TPA: hypothetical protein VNO81_13460, partial [Candidatus Nitrosotenuis sp.]|nr:hypothetical protein [Candidatus Nitrosotenuis sp.]